jgi:hypothetical protein
MKGNDMMKVSSKLIAIGAASVLGVVLAAGGAQAASGAMAARDTPGKVLQVGGVGPASAQSNATGAAHANPSRACLKPLWRARPHIQRRTL